MNNGCLMLSFNGQRAKLDGVPKEAVAQPARLARPSDFDAWAPAAAKARAYSLNPAA